MRRRLTKHRRKFVLRAGSMEDRGAEMKGGEAMGIRKSVYSDREVLCCGKSETIGEGRKQHCCEVKVRGDCDREIKTGKYVLVSDES